MDFPDISPLSHHTVSPLAPSRLSDNAISVQHAPVSDTVVSHIGEPGIMHVAERDMSLGLYAPIVVIDTTHREIAAAQVYKMEVRYHVTTGDGKRSIQRQGFRKSQKSRGAIAELMNHAKPSPEEFRNANMHHYAFTNMTITRNFQKKYLKNRSDPRIVKFFAGNVPFEPDPDFVQDEFAKRTSTDIPAAQILKSRRVPSTIEESEMMRQGLERRGVQVTRQEAGRLLREVQSDSEDDFSSRDGANKPFWQKTRESGIELSSAELAKKLNAPLRK